MTGLSRIIVIAGLFALAACDSAEERAEKHFQNALELLETGDVDRAMIEFRNVLALDERHSEARRVYASAARDAGNLSVAYSQFLRLVEERPDDAEARLALTEIAILAQNWEEAERHGARLVEVQGDVEGREVVELALAFRKAMLDKDAATARELTRKAEALAQTYPDDPILDRVLIEGYMLDRQVDKAIAVAETALARGGENRLYYRILADLLVAKGDVEGLEAHFRRMIEVFPEDDSIKGNLISLLVQDGRAESAEQLLRDEIADAEDKQSAHVSLVALIRQTRGDAAALAEIESAIEAYEDNALLRALKAGILFDSGQRDQAVTLMQSVVDGAEIGNETDRFKVTLARMLVATGNDVGARTLVEAVLERDAGQVDALKMRANWQIENDEADAAIATLRAALDQEPEDAEAMTLMARAHERNGDRQLAQDLLALAVEASGNAPVESLRFARVLIGQERYSTAEEILVSALRRAPGHVELLTSLGQVYLATEDWPRAEQVAATLDRQDVPAAGLAADELRLQIVSRREGRTQGIEYLEGLVAEGGASDPAAAKVALIRARLVEQDGEAALALARELADEMPGDPRAGMVLGNTQLALGDFTGAEATFRDLLDADPTRTLPAIQLMRVLGSQGRIDEAREVVDAGLTQNPENPDLLWAKASFLERDNDIDGAIGIYERLYALNSDSQILANNLASLLATYRDDEASLDRAYAVGRRLNGTKVPPFQDTYGWILYRRGQTEEALTYLEPAAEALSADPIVQYHLGMAYAALDRSTDALARFETVLELADNDDPRPQISKAAAEIERLQAAGSQ